MFSDRFSEEAPVLSVNGAAVGVTVKSQDWRIISEGRIDVGISGRFATRLTIAADSSAKGASYVIVRVPDAQPLIIDLHIVQAASEAG